MPDPAARPPANRWLVLAAVLILMMGPYVYPSKQDLAPDNLKFGDKFEPTPLPRPGVTKFV